MQLPDSGLLDTLKDAAGIFTGAAALVISYASFKLSKDTATLNKRSLSEGIRPILDLDFHMDAHDTHVTLSNKGLGVAAIKSAVAKRVVPGTQDEIESSDLFRLFSFDNVFDWNMCTTFPEGRTRYLAPGKGLILFHIDKPYLLSQQRGKPWITENSIDDICHLMNHQLGEMSLRVNFEDARGEAIEPFVFDFTKFFPLPGTPDPRVRTLERITDASLSNQQPSMLADRAPAISAGTDT